MVKDETGDKNDDRDYEANKKENDKVRKAWRVTSLLNPMFETDTIIKVESRTINGEYRIVRGVHNRDFNTELVVVEA